jgi:hypothetical protein
MSNFKWLASVTLAVTTFPAFQAEAHCPRNVASLRLRLVQRSRIIAPVVINHTGPYDFLVDTGAQITMVDPSLAAELHLKSQDTAEVVGVGFHTRGSLARLDLLEVGSKAIANPLVVVPDLEPSKEADLHLIRGSLGGNFLQHFDVLIDYEHSMLCLDDRNVMLQEAKGERIALVTPRQMADEVSLTRLVIAVHLSRVGTQQLLLKLDSGTNGPLLYDPGKYLAAGLFVSTSVRGRGADGTERTFGVLPPQDMRIGTLTFHQISFVTPAARKDIPKLEVDGLLPTAIFRCVYISYADRFVVL